MNKDVTILLIEDDDVDAMSIMRTFKQEKIANVLVRAHDGIEALEILAQGRVDAPYIILLDLQMPRMNGLEFLKAFRDDYQYTNCVVFVLTTSKADEDMIASYQKNIAGYFLKSSTSDKLLEIVKVLDGYWKIVQFPMK
ncbi:response regulator [Colwellia echini]|uniref:Response regulator n=1 Tax=Colwellia echini TaxID=1982103 RepID=A0ABY3N0U8_9GAMM|nr:response regulator [Colwellia echini]TYK67034.1 response regulator [Colwellia echini]